MLQEYYNSIKINKMNVMSMNFLKKPLIHYLQKENKNIKFILQKLLKNNKFFYLDIGAAEGTPKRWKIVENIVEKILIEPHPESAKELRDMGYNVIDKVLYSKTNIDLSFNHAKKKMCSSFLDPNLNHLSKFSNSERFHVVKKTKFNTSTLDEELRKVNKKPDFMKIDAEGTEIEILKGSTQSLKNMLGIEIEGSFFQIRKNQPLVNDILKFLSSAEFEFIDFLSIIRWDKYKYRYTGQPQITDLLFLVRPETVIKKYNQKIYSREKLLNYISILTVYLRSDYLKFLNNEKSIRKEIPELKNLCKLVDTKINRINLIEEYSNILKNKIYNL